MNGCTTTRVWNINDKLVIADTIENAISLYQQYYDTGCSNTMPIDITKVEAVSNSSILKDYNAIIKEE